MPIADAVKPVQKVTLSEMAQDFADKFGVITWGNPGSQEGDSLAVALQLKNPLMQELAVEERIRLTCSGGASMTLADGGDGRVLSGDNSDDILIETDSETGRFDLEVSYEGTGDVTVIGGVTQGSGFVHCGQSITLSFT